MSKRRVAELVRPDDAGRSGSPRYFGTARAAPMTPFWREYAARKAIPRFAEPKQPRARLTIGDYGDKQEWPRGYTTTGRVRCQHGETQQVLEPTRGRVPLWKPIEDILNEHDITFRCRCTFDLWVVLEDWKTRSAEKSSRKMEFGRDANEIQG